MTRDKLIKIINEQPQEHGKGLLSEYLTTNEVAYIADSILADLDQEISGSRDQTEESEDTNEKGIFVRLKVSDLVMPIQDYKRHKSSYITAEVETYDPEYELEDGTECDENGNEI